MYQSAERLFFSNIYLSSQWGVVFNILEASLINLSLNFTILEIDNVVKLSDRIRSRLKAVFEKLTLLKSASFSPLDFQWPRIVFIVPFWRMIDGWSTTGIYSIISGCCVLARSRWYQMTVMVFWSKLKNIGFFYFKYRNHR